MKEYDQKESAVETTGSQSTACENEKRKRENATARTAERQTRADEASRKGKNGTAARGEKTLALQEGESSGGLSVGAKRVIAVLCVVALAIAAFIAVTLFTVPNSPKNATSVLSGTAVFRLNDETEPYRISLEPSCLFRPQDEVVWKVNGKEYKREKAVHEESRVFEFHPQAAGEYTLQAEFTGYENLNQTMAITVRNPLLVLQAEDATVRYGDALPQLHCCVGDHDDEIELYPLLTTDAKEGCDVGSYEIRVENAEVAGYDVECRPGTLTVLPRELKWSLSEKEKIYDGTTDFVTNAVYRALPGDDVGIAVRCELTGAAVGKQKVSYSVEISGEQAKNYRPVAEDEWIQVLPRQLYLSVVANDKLFDGTTAVTFSEVGELQNLLEQDEVAVGGLKARFETSAIGEQKRVLIDRVELVGRDAANYKVQVNETYAAILQIA